MIGAAASLLIAVVAACGLTLVVKARARLSGLWLLIGALIGAAVVAVRVLDGSPDLDRLLVVAATYLALPAAVLAYPSWVWRRPVDFIISTTLVASGVLSVVYFRDSAVTDPMGLVLGLAVAVHLWWRIETTSGDTRIALQWLAVTMGVVGLLFGLISFAAEGDGANGTVISIVLLLLCLPVAPSMVVGVLRPDVLDVRGVVVWGVVTFVTVIVYLSVFAGIVAGIDALGGEPSPGALGLIGAVLALGFHPTLVLLRGVVDQLLFGDRPDPLQAATHVADRIGDDPVLALRAIREALVLPYASLRADGQTLATSGTEVTHTRTLPLKLGGDAVGEIVVGLRAGDLTLAASDADVLRIVAPLLAQTLRAQVLARDLQTSRNAAITAIEEERRRLRRDLHDGLGPTLSGVAFATDAARNHLVNDPAAADALLEKLRADTSAAIAEVRRLVEGLRPPALDELGLLGAVRQHAATLHADGGAPLQVTISAPEPLPELSAATEVTVYRIVVEALTNVARHAAATRAAVEIGVTGGDLRLSVQDDGRDAGGWRPGVGMSSMRERAEQVGGTLTARPRADGGRVEASIPLGTG
ncbi:MAG: sensor histidine kinase [Aeromicrobium sp.]